MWVMKQVKTKTKYGWSDWQFPIMKGYKMGCCDCRLVHEMRFKVIRVAKTYKDGRMKYEDVKDKTLRIAMKGKRNFKDTKYERSKI